MSTQIMMPSLGFDMTAGKLARWLKQEGDKVEKGEAIAEVETEKATVEIQAFGSGILQRILVKSGETVPVNTLIGIIAAPGEKIQSSPAPTPVASSLPTAEPEPAVVPQEESPSNGRVKASPIARRMADAAGIDLHGLKGTGPGGRIMEKDVQAAIDQKQASTPTASGSPETKPVRAEAGPASIERGPVGENQLKLSRMRQTIAQRMTLSKTTVPHFYVTIEINMGEALRVREQLNQLSSDAEKVSVNDMVLAAAARTLSNFPTLNASFHGDALDLHPNVNIGVAIAVEEGLLTLALMDANRKSLKQIAAETKGMSERAKANKLKPEDLGPSTFTVSNLGMFGVDEFAAIINPPEAAILAVGAATKRAIVVDNEIKIAPIMKATIAVDHRVADGAQAARFLHELKKILENPVNLLLT